MSVPTPDSQYEAAARTMWVNFTKAAMIGTGVTIFVLVMMAITLL